MEKAREEKVAREDPVRVGQQICAGIILNEKNSGHGVQEEALQEILGQFQEMKPRLAGQNRGGKNWQDKFKRIRILIKRTQHRQRYEAEENLRLIRLQPRVPAPNHPQCDDLERP